MQRVVAKADVQTGIATWNRMADLVALMRIEQQDLVALRDRIITPEMAHEDAAIGKDQMGRVRALLAAAMPALSGADDIAHQHDLAIEEIADRELRHACLPQRDPKEKPARQGRDDLAGPVFTP